MTLEVCSTNPHLSHKPITAGVRGQEDRILRPRGLLQLKQEICWIQAVNGGGRKRLRQLTWMATGTSCPRWFR